MKRINPKKILKIMSSHFILIFFATIVLIPILWMVSTGLKTTEETFATPIRWIPEIITFSNFKNIVVEYPFAVQFKNSAINAIVAAFIVVVTATLAAYSITRFNFKGKNLIQTLLLVVQMFPAIMLLVPFYVIMSAFSLIDTHIAVIMVLVAVSLPFSVWMMVGFFKDIPNSLDEAATIDGCSKFQVFYKIVMPLTIPGMASIAIYAFVVGWNDYMFSSTLLTQNKLKTLTVGVAEFAGQYNVEWNEMMAASIVTCLPLMMLFIFLQKYFISGMTAGAVKQ